MDVWHLYNSIHGGDDDDDDDACSVPEVVAVHDGIRDDVHPVVEAEVQLMLMSRIQILELNSM